MRIDTSADRTSALGRNASHATGLLAKYGPAALIVLVVAVTMAPLFGFYMDGRFTGDGAQQYLPFKMAAIAAIRNGELPLWNPYLFSGAPLLADPQNSLLYPTFLLHLALPPSVSFPLNQFLHVLICAFGTYALARLYVDRVAAAASAIAFAIGVPIFFKLATGVDAILQVIAWLPWVMYCLERFFRSQRPVWAIGAGVVFALIILAGFPTHVVYTLLGASLFCLWRLAPDVRRGAWRPFGIKLAWLLLAFGLAVVLSAAQLLPTIELIRQSSRSNPEDSFLYLGSLQLVMALTALIPDIFGSPSTHTAIFGVNAGEHALYVGALPVLFVLVYAAFLKRRRGLDTNVYLVIAAVFLVLAFGLHNPIYRAAVGAFPPLRQLADPGRMAMFFGLYLAIAFAVSIQNLGQWLPDMSRRTRVLLVAVFGLMCGGLLAGLAMLTLGQPVLARIAAPFVERQYAAQAAEKLAELPALFGTQAFSVLMLLFVTGAAGLMLWSRATNRISARTFALTCLIVITIDVGAYSWRQTTTIRTFDTVATPDFIEYLRKQSRPFRVLPLNAMTFINRGSRFEIESITGYNPLMLRAYQNLLGVMRGEPVLPSDRVPLVTRATSPLLDLLDVRYVVSEEPVSDPSLERRFDGATDVYARKSPQASRAALVYDAQIARNDDEAIAMLSRPDFDPARSVVLMDSAAAPERAAGSTGTSGQATLVGQSFNTARVQVESPAPGWLVLGEVFYPGWKAYVDGVEAPIARANLAMRALQVPAGRHVVEMRYEPDSFRLGAVLSALGLIAAVGLIFTLGRRRTSGWATR